jgi:hypothetical protein
MTLLLADCSVGAACTCLCMPPLHAEVADCVGCALLLPLPLRTLPFAFVD